VNNFSNLFNSKTTYLILQQYNKKSCKIVALDTVDLFTYMFLEKKERIVFND